MALSALFSQFRSRLLCVLCILLTTIFIGCGGSGNNGGTGGTPPLPTPPVPQLVSIAISPSSASLALGTSTQLKATGTYSDGSSKDLTNATSWSSATVSVATVSSSGLVGSVAQGVTVITASLGTISGTASVTVGPPVLTGIAVSPSQAKVYVGTAPQKFSAIGVYSDKSTADVTSSASWSTSNSYVSQIDGQGNVTSIRSGYTTVSATAGGFAASGVLTVLAYPRYMVYTNLADRLVSRSSIDAVTGQLRMIGYQATGANNVSAADCATTDPEGQYLYLAHLVGLPTDPLGQVEIYKIDGSSGSLTALSGSPFALTAPVGCIQFEPSGRFGYATASLNNTNNQLVTYSRDPATGMLQQTGSISLPNAAWGVAIDPLGQYLYLATAYLGSGTTSAAYGYSIDAITGSLTPIPGTPFALSSNSGNFSFHPSENFIYMSNSGGLSIDAYAIDRTTGKLSSQLGGSVSTCINPSPLSFAPDGNSAYATCSMDVSHDPQSASLVSFAVSASRQLSVIGSAATLDVPGTPLIDPSGQFVYISALFSYIDAFGIGSDGVAKATQQFGARNQVGSMLALSGTSPVHYASLNAYVSTIGDNRITDYPILPGGGWGTAAQSVVAQLSPFSLSLAPEGVDLLSTGLSAAPNVTPYSVDPATGALTQGFVVGGAEVSGGVVVDQSGVCAFQTDSKNGRVYPYFKISNHWNMQIYVGAQAGAGPMAIDPVGQFLFVANQAANSISVFQYFGTSPQLIEMNGHWTLPYTDGSPYPLTASPAALAVSPTGGYLYVVTLLSGYKSNRVNWLA
jgi:6-phosphogluconolactonase (cycloisomerase 2 family)